LTGDIYALVDHPFGDVDAAFNGTAHWCDVLILHINTKYCRASTDKAGAVLTVGRQPDGLPDYIRGVRGVIERNAMRYYLAIDAYLAALAVPPPEQLEERLQGWFASAERYPRQLHEVDRTAYLDMKRREYLRQQTAR